MITWLVHNTVLAGLLAVGVAVFCRVSRCRPGVRHALWLIVLLRLLMPPGLHWPWALPWKTARPEEPAAVATAPAAPVVHDTTAWHSEPIPDDLPDGDWLAAAALPTETVEEPTTEVAPPVVEPTPIRWWLWLGHGALAVWVLGSAVVLGRHLWRLRRLRRWVRLASPAPGGLAARVAELAFKFGIRPPRVLVVPGLPTPLVGCLPRPVLLWPAGLETRLPNDGVKAVLAHELAHLRRGDHWVRWLEVLAEGVWWWHPLFALVRRKLRQNAELACDAWVVTLLPAARRAYAEALLTVCETAGRPAEPAPALGVGGDDRRDFQRRLTMIMREPVNGRIPRRALAAVGLVALLAVPGWTLGQNAPPADRPLVTDVEKVEQIELVFDRLDPEVELFVELLDAADKAKAEPASPDREKRLEALEAKIQAILKEIAALRQEERRKQQTERLHAEHERATKAARDAAQKAAREGAEKAQKAARDQAAKAREQAEKAREQGEKARADAARQRAEAEQNAARAKAAEALRNRARRADAGNTVKATYTLPAGKANALAAFLKSHLKASVVEATVEGDKLTVTTTPEAQKAIGQLIGLIPGGTSGTEKSKPEPKKSGSSLQFQLKPPTTVKPTKP